MLGNWSFGDYFKKDAIDWAWELVVERWKFPANRLYASVFCPDMSLWQASLTDAVRYAKLRMGGTPVQGLGDEVTGGAQGSAAINWPDDEAASYWAEHFLKAGLDPMVHIVPGNRKDNFWMMGETGPCGPCSEIHVDLTPQGDTKGSLVNKGSAECIEIWNLVFIQFNANPDGSFSPLPAKHVDTGMGFERVAGIIQNTRNFTDFNQIISNYETDIFRPIFDRIEKLSGKRYGSTLPPAGSTGNTEQEKIDVAFRVVADHIRTLSFAIADGIQPGNTDRNYVLRRILRRAVRYGRTLGFREPFFYKLVDVLAQNMGHVFPEICAKREQVEEVIQREEEAFNKTLDEGIRLFEAAIDAQEQFVQAFAKNWPRLKSYITRVAALPDVREPAQERLRQEPEFAVLNTEFLEPLSQLLKVVVSSRLAGNIPERNLFLGDFLDLLDAVRGLELLAEKATMAKSARLFHEEFAIFNGQLPSYQKRVEQMAGRANIFPGKTAFLLYDTYGFPLDLTELMCRERGFTLDDTGFNELMEEQRARARAAQRRTVVELAKLTINEPTVFVGYEALSISSRTVGIVGIPEWGKVRRSVATESTPFYAEMGGQVGDTGTITSGGRTWQVINTLRAGPAFCHVLSDADQSEDMLTYQGNEVELVVDRRRRAAIQRHHTVTHLLHWALHEIVSQDAVQKGSYVGPDKLTFDFSSAPLTPQQVIEVEQLVNERILENAPVAWTEVKYSEIKERKEIMQFFGEKYGSVVRVVQIGGKAGGLDGYSMELCGGTHTRATGEIGLFRIVGESAIAAGIRRIEAISGLEAYRRANDELHLLKTLSGKVNSPVGELEKKIESLLAQQKELEKQARLMQQKQAVEVARSLVAKAQTLGTNPAIVENLGAGDGDFLQSIADALKGQFKGVVVLGGVANNSVSLVATVSPELTKKLQAGKIIQAIAPVVGGKGGGRPDNARGGGKDVGKLDEALAKARELVGKG
jgi:alanyl-tRNA synthetase